MNSRRRRVVITGMGVLSSLAKDVPQFKQVLFNRQCNIKPSQRYLKWFKNANGWFRNLGSLWRKRQAKYY